MVKYKEVYHIEEFEDKEGEKGSRWTRIGSAFVNRDDSLNVVLHCIPVNGRLHIRDPRDNDDRDDDKQERKGRRDKDDDKRDARDKDAERKFR